MGFSPRRAITALCMTASIVTAGLALPAAASADVGQPAAPSDAFFRVGASDYSSAAPGQILRTRTTTLAHFPGSTVDQIVFGSRNSHDEPIAGTATLVKPPNMAPNAPVLTYAHFINSLGVDCQPSLTFTSPNPEAQFLGAQIAAANIALARGWAVLFPDHEGLEAAYGANVLGGKITLDAIRAAKNGPFGVTNSPQMIAGYSGGSMVSAFAAGLQPTYAPDVKLAGVAAGGIPADYNWLVRKFIDANDLRFNVALSVAIGLDREYPNLNVVNRLNQTGKDLISTMSNACTNSMFAAPTGQYSGAVTDESVDSLFDPYVTSVLAENSVVNAGTPRVPFFLWQSKTDGLVPYEPVQNLIDKYCAAGVPLTVSEGSGTDHVTVAALGIPDVLNWLDQRLSGQPAGTTCGGPNLQPAVEGGSLGAQ